VRRASLGAGRTDLSTSHRGPCGIPGKGFPAGTHRGSVHFRARLTRGAVLALSLLLATTGVVSLSVPGRAAVTKPAYTAGDRWTYVLQGSLGALPGFNASNTGAFELDLNGLVEVDIVGPTQARLGGNLVSAVLVSTHASGFLNGTFEIPGTFPIAVSGTFSSDASEVWEDQGYLTIASNSTSGYIVSMTVIITTQIRVDLWLNTTTLYESIPPFAMGVGDSADIPSYANVTAAYAISGFGPTQSMENRTTFASTWSREVLSEENVAVEAGTFSAVRLNESLASFPGLSGIPPAGGANETAWFSDDVGYYVERVAYVNGTPVAEMRLKSYAYAASPRSLSLLDRIVLVAIPIFTVGVLVGFLLLLRRRRRAREASKTPRTIGTIGDVPPKEPGGP